MRRIQGFAVVAAMFCAIASNSGAQPIPVVFVVDDARDDNWEAASTAAFDAHVARDVPLTLGMIPCANGSSMADDGTVDCREAQSSPPFHETVVQWANDHPGFFEVVQHGTTHERSPSGMELRDFPLEIQREILATGLARMASWGLPGRQPVTFSVPFAAGNHDTVEVAEELQFASFFIASETFILKSDELEIFTHPVFACEGGADGPSCVFRSANDIISDVKLRAQNPDIPAVVVIYHVQDLLLSVEPGDPNRDEIDPAKVDTLHDLLKAFAHEDAEGTIELTTFEDVVDPGVPDGGSDGVGLYDADVGGFHLTNANRCAPADESFTFGPGDASWRAVSGDWNGDGLDTVGLYDAANGMFHLRNDASGGPADVSFAFGPNDVRWTPIAGDWNGDGVDGVGLYDPMNGVYYLRDAHANGPADRTYVFGPGQPGWIAIAGDWNGDGVDGVGLYDSSNGAFFLRNEHSSGPADESYVFGPDGSSWLPIAGDWNGDGIGTVGLYDPEFGVFYLNDDHSNGPSEAAFKCGPDAAGWTPLAGNWNGL